MLKSKLSLSRHFEYANKQITYHFWLCAIQQGTTLYPQKNHVIVCLYQYIFTLRKVLWWVIFCKRSFGLLLYWQHRKGGGGLYFVNFQMTGVWCAFVIPKRQKLSLNLWGGGQGVVFFHSSSSFSLPRLLSPFSSFFPFGFISCLPHFSPTSPFFHPLLSPTPCLPSPFPPHLCGHDCCEYHTHICVEKIVTPLKF